MTWTLFFLLSVVVTVINITLLKKCEAFTLDKGDIEDDLIGVCVVALIPFLNILELAFLIACVLAHYIKNNTILKSGEL